MNLYTSRYQNGAGIIESGAAPIRITVGAPRFKLDYTLWGSIGELAPERAWFDSPDFEEIYRAKLNSRTVGYYRERFNEYGSDALVLLCFENVSKGEVCHRRMFAQWWEEQTGDVVAELPDQGKAGKPSSRAARKPEISEEVSRKGDRLISEGKVRKLDDSTYQVAGDSGLYLVKFSPKRAPIYCDCPKFQATPWRLCSHRVAAWRVDQGIVATLF